MLGPHAYCPAEGCTEVVRRATGHASFLGDPEPPTEWDAVSGLGNRRRTREVHPNAGAPRVKKPRDERRARIREAARQIVEERTGERRPPRRHRRVNPTPSAPPQVSVRHVPGTWRCDSCDRRRRGGRAIALTQAAFELLICAPCGSKGDDELRAAAHEILGEGSQP